LLFSSRTGGAHAQRDRKWFSADFIGIFDVSGPSAVIAAEACQCKGCGCKGGSGWRGPDGFCISQAKLAEVCCTPAGAPCKQEAAPRICFGKS
jgi:hypothetical protein